MSQWPRFKSLVEHTQAKEKTEKKEERENHEALQVLSGLRRAVSGLNHAKKHRGPQTAKQIATEVEADKMKANSSLIMRDITKLL